MATESSVDNKDNKPGFFRRIGRWFKGAALELKKTTWPKRADVFKKLGTVMIVVLFFFIVLLIMDNLLGYGFRALTGAEGVLTQVVAPLGDAASIPIRGL